ncbi:Serine/threonine-protein kinase PknD [Stieleria maiorica]|uniref:Serine/threonine-protein kinase PknD n=1 Tax=Stieleria maiorica TaxID=2795974 RepID=A0A5B9MLS7_9BACT|nr:protein kinase [Stieleria maiorica]QEG02243.1 Serine/threonine-protein kinase PknD [Stieleria maiorica]
MVILEQGSEPIPGYFLAEKLGEGSFGVVWSADGPGETRVALKFLDLYQAGGAKEFESISAIKNIRHPNLLPITGFWLLDRSGKPIRDGRANRFRLTSSEPATLVIAMVAGEKSLDDVLQDHRSHGRPGIPLPELLDYAEDAARGLDFLNSPRHDLGDGRRVSIAHRDIKPDNILLVGDAAVLCDFGVARPCYAESIRSTGMIGSPAFISPESISGNASGGASDQYSLALTYYYLRTGDHAIRATDQATALHCHVTGELNFSKVGPAEQRVLQRATRMETNERFESCRQMVRALHRAIAHSPHAAPPDTSITQLNADVTETAIDPRFDSTTAAAGDGATAAAQQPMSVVGRTGSWRKQKPGRHRAIRRVIVSVVMVTLAAIAVVFVSRGPEAQTEKRSSMVEPATKDTPHSADRRVTPTGARQDPGQAASADDRALQSSLPEALPVAVQPEPDVAEAPDVNLASTPSDADAESAMESVAEEAFTPETTAPETTTSEIVAPAPASPPAPAETINEDDLTIAVFARLGGTLNHDRTELDLSGTKVTTADLSRLRFLPSLVSLSLENTPIGDEALAEIVRRQPKLQSLYLAKTKVTDAGLEHLRSLTDLVRVDLASCKVNDEGLVHLHSLENLQAVGLNSTAVSPAGMETLSEALSHRAVIQGPEFSLLGGKRFDVMH